MRERRRPWLPIASVPKDGTHVILYIEGCAVEGWWEIWPDRRRPDLDTWRTAALSEHGCGCCGSSNDAPTHWMPLPPGPGSQQV